MHPIAVLSLCWLVEDYPVAEFITQSLGERSLSLSLLTQADRFLQIFESSVFAHVRLHFLDVHNPELPSMLRSVLGLMMLLPQSEAYTVCMNRLSNLTCLYYLLSLHSDVCFQSVVCRYRVVFAKICCIINIRHSFTTTCRLLSAYSHNIVHQGVRKFKWLKITHTTFVM